MEGKLRSWRPRKHSERTARQIDRMGIQNPVWLQKTFRKIRQTPEWWCTVVLRKYDPLERYLCIFTPQNSLSEVWKRTSKRPNVFWEQILWTDEVKIELSGQKWATVCLEIKGCKIMTSLQLLRTGMDQSVAGGNISLVNGRMDSIKYQQILEANLPTSVKEVKVKRGGLLQQDNGPKHP